jgi:hypothetical protein
LSAKQSRRLAKRDRPLLDRQQPQTLRRWIHPPPLINFRAWQPFGSRPVQAPELWSAADCYESGYVDSKHARAGARGVAPRPPAVRA